MTLEQLIGRLSDIQRMPEQSLRAEHLYLLREELRALTPRQSDVIRMRLGLPGNRAVWQAVEAGVSRCSEDAATAAPSVAASAPRTIENSGLLLFGAEGPQG